MSCALVGALLSPKNVTDALRLLPNFAGVIQTPWARNKTFQLVAMYDDREHLIDQIVREHAFLWNHEDSARLPVICVVAFRI